jgi:hypothetical protein
MAVRPTVGDLSVLVNHIATYVRYLSFTTIPFLAIRRHYY